MIKCHDIQKLLPLYEEGILADAEKQAVADGLNPVNNERIGLCDALIRKDLCKTSQ